MTNEIILIINLFIVYGGVLLWLYLFGEQGLISFTVFATILANIEVLMVVDAFGMTMTLGNILFASTFLITDILSELYGKKSSNRAVNIGIATTISMVIITFFWVYYVPAASDWACPSIKEIFSVTPRVMFVSLLVFAIVQKFDVWLYHKWWNFTEKKCGDRKKYLWVRNNFSTLISQFLNNLLFTFGAFWGIYSTKDILQIVISTYIIYIVTSLCDTPAIYLARKLPTGVLNKKD